MRHSALVVTSFAMLLAPMVAAADVTITDCAVDAACSKFGSKTVIKAPNDRVVVAAPIEPLPGTRVIKIEAREIQIAPAGGITADGKGHAIELLAETAIEIRGLLRATNTNGDVVVEAGGLINVLGPEGPPPPQQMLDAGDRVVIVCDGAGCIVSIKRATLNARRIYVEAEGDVQLCDNLFETASPRDLIRLTSHEGSIVQSPATLAPSARGQTPSTPTLGQVIDPLELLLGSCGLCEETFCGDGVIVPDETCDDASLIAGGTPVFLPGAPPGRTCRPPNHPNDPCTFCGDGLLQTGEQCDDGNAIDDDGCSNACLRVCENEFRGGVESRMFATAAKDIDVAGVRLVIEVAENITLTAGSTINLTNAIVSNLHGKQGEIEIEAGRGTGLVTIAGATIRDDQKGGQPEDVSEINRREDVPHTGYNNVVGTPLVDD